MFDLQTNIHVAGAMTELQRIVCAGYIEYRHGVVPVDQAMAMLERFESRHKLSMSEDQRSHARRKGKAVYRLVMYPAPNSTELHWWLLRTPGHYEDDDRRWRSVKKDRLEWVWWYELVQLPVPPAHRAKYNRTLKDGTDGRAKDSVGSKKPRQGINAVTWTWRIKPRVVQELKQDLRFYLYKQDHRLEQLVLSIRRAPGFRGIRGDVYGLYGFIQRQARNQGRACPELPETIPWVRNQRFKKAPLSSLVRRANSGAESWFPDEPSGTTGA